MTRCLTAADQLVFVPGPSPVIAQHAQALSDAVVVGHDRPGVAQRSEVLAGEKTEAPCVTTGSRVVPVPPSAVGLRCIFHNSKVVLLCKLDNSIHLDHAAIQVHRNDRLGPLGEPFASAREIDKPTVRLDVDEARGCPRRNDSLGCSDERVGWNQDLATGGHTDSRQCQAERLCAICNCNHMMRPQILRESLLEGDHLMSTHISSAAYDSQHRFLELIVKLRVDGLQISKTDLVRHAGDAFVPTVATGSLAPRLRSER